MHQLDNKPTTALLHLPAHRHEEQQEEASQLEEEEVEAEEGEDADLMTDLNLPKLIWTLRWRTTRRTWLLRYITYGTRWLRRVEVMERGETTVALT